jgi:hypothetical protein
MSTEGYKEAIGEEENELNFRVRQLTEKVNRLDEGTCPIGARTKWLFVFITVLFIMMVYFRGQLIAVNKQLAEEIARNRPFEVPLVTKGQHNLEFHDHPQFTFPYPTMGIPIPGNTFNNTPVPKEKLAEYDRTINELFKPYNVPLIIFRILIAFSEELVVPATEAT